MEAVFSLLFYLGIFLLVRSVNKKKKAAQKKGPAAGPASERPAPSRPAQRTPAQRAQAADRTKTMPSAAFGEPEQKKAAPSAPRTRTAQPPVTRQKTMPSAAFAAEEKPPVKTAPVAPRVAQQGGSGLTHTVKSTFEGGHAHEETSMTGFSDCPPEKEAHGAEPRVAVQPAEAPETPLVPVFTPADTVRAVIFSEILSKPKALR